MKNIKSITLAIFCMSSVACVLAQTETKKMTDRPVPQVALPPVQLPEMPNAPKPVANAVPVAEKPSPSASDKNQQPEQTVKPNFKLVDNKEPEAPGGEEGKKIMAGKATKPAPVINNHSTIDPTPAPQLTKPAKPVNGQQQQ